MLHGLMAAGLCAWLWRTPDAITALVAGLFALKLGWEHLLGPLPFTASAMVAPSSNTKRSSRCGRPRNCGKDICSEPLRARSVALEIEALSSISITTVMMSPRWPARLSPSNEARLAVHKDEASAGSLGST